MDKATFEYILHAVQARITKDDVVGDTIKPNIRLAICLSRLIRGEYFYNIAEDYGVGKYKGKIFSNSHSPKFVKATYT